jgi:hypothetical protein
MTNQFTKGSDVVVNDGWFKMHGKIVKSCTGKWAGWYVVSVGNWSAKFHEQSLEARG